MTKPTGPLRKSSFVHNESVRCPLCCHTRHCGSRAVLGEPEDRGGCVNRTITCLSCGRTGEQRTRKDVRGAV